MRTYKHMTKEERLRIVALRGEGLSIVRIAELTGRAHQTVGAFLSSLPGYKPRSKRLTAEKRDEIQTRRHLGLSYVAIAREMGLNKSTVRYVCDEAGVHSWPPTHKMTVRLSSEYHERLSRAAERENLLPADFLQGLVNDAIYEACKP